MTRKEMIEKLKELKCLLLEELDIDEITDYTREQTCICIEAAIDFLKENEE